MNEGEAAFLDLAEHQYGVGSRAQAREAGMTEQAIDRRTAQSRFEAIYPAVYRVPGSPRTGRQRAMAATLWLGPNAAISHTTAATLLRLDGCKTTDLHVTVPREVRRRVNDDGTIVHRTLDLPRRDIVQVDGIRCTNATRTLIDSASLLDSEQLEVAFESARRMGLTTTTVFARRAAELSGKGRAGSATIRALLSHQRAGDPALQFRLEVKTARLLRSSGLPRPNRQHQVGKYSLDYAWLPRMFAVECEGYEVHGNRLAWKRDKRRTAALEELGWRLMFVTWDDVVRHPEQTVERIRLALV